MRKMMGWLLVGKELKECILQWRFSTRGVGMGGLFYCARSLSGKRGTCLEAIWDNGVVGSITRRVVCCVSLGGLAMGNGKR